MHKTKTLRKNTYTDKCIVRRLRVNKLYLHKVSHLEFFKGKAVLKNSGKLAGAYLHCSATFLKLHAYSQQVFKNCSSPRIFAGFFGNSQITALHRL